MECFETFAAAMADFYAMHPPLLPNPNGDELSQAYYNGKVKGNAGHGECPEPFKSDIVVLTHLISGFDWHHNADLKVLP